MRIASCLIAAALLAACAVPGKMAASHIPKNAVAIRISPQETGAAIPGHFLGLSYETETLLPRPDGSHYFSPDNAPLVGVFKSLGVRSLRIGGNSVDRPGTPIPAENDIASLFEFAKTADVKIIYSVRLQDGDAASAAKIAAYIHANYAAQLDCFAIGNEPSYFKTYEAWREKWSAIGDAMDAAAPGVPFCAPDTNPNAAWVARIADDFGPEASLVQGRVVMLAQHNYPGDCSYKNPFTKDIKDLVPKDAAACREELVSGSLRKIYEKTRLTIPVTVLRGGLPFRLTETNSYWFGGLKGASDTHAAALWSLDYMNWWARSGADGLNFHTGDIVGGGKGKVPCRYAAFVTANDGYDVHPLGYGIKFFDLTGGGAPVAVSTDDQPTTAAAAQATRIFTYAAMPDDKTLCVTLINNAHGPGAAPVPASITLPPGAIAKSARVIFLAAPDGDIAATGGLTLGGAPIGPDGAWDGHWTPLRLAGKTLIPLTLPPASAALVKIQLR